jgi:hypothetical protein
MMEGNSRREMRLCAKAACYRLHGAYNTRNASPNRLRFAILRVDYTVT